MNNEFRHECKKYTVVLNKRRLLVKFSSKESFRDLDVPLSSVTFVKKCNHTRAIIQSNHPKDIKGSLVNMTCVTRTIVFDSTPDKIDEFCEQYKKLTHFNYN